MTTVGAPGLMNAVRAGFDRSIRIRCCHCLANIRAKLPAETVSEVLAHVYAARDAPTLDAARAAADRFADTFARECPAAVACFSDLDALLAIHRVPVRHRIRVRTTNLAGRSFEEDRRRTKVIPRLMSEQGTMKLVFATMIRSAEQVMRGVGQRSRASPTEAAFGRSSGSTLHRRKTTPPDEGEGPSAQGLDRREPSIYRSART